ncbi:c-type cytochrome [Methylobacillus sp.]|uniref:c-type cytochrome n=1 Tax=Methylobacillus sp. TaxID=56818 RepID=UPI002FDF1937
MSRRHTHTPQPATANPVKKSNSTMLDLHDQVIYETPEPFEDMISGPSWFYLLVIVTLVVGAFYLGRHMGNLDTAAHNGFLQATQPAGNQSTRSQLGAAPATAVSGAAIFTSRCVSCHQASGQGIPGAFPPLVKSPFVLGEPEILAHIVLQGLQGELQVEGQTYNGIMPPWQDQLSDEEAAAVINHIRNELGDNKAGKVDVELIKKVREDGKDRKTPWTAKELEALGKS